MDNENKTPRRPLKKDRQIKSHKFNYNWLSWKTRNKVISIIAILILIISIFVYFIPEYRSNQPLSFLIVGTDTDDFREKEYNGKKPKRTDAIMVATFNPQTYNVEVTSIPRDTSVDYACSVQKRDVRGPINEIYEVSGRKIDCLRASVSKFLNVPIDYYALINMSQLSKLVDSVGGITVDVHAKDGGFCQVTTDVSKKYCFKDGDVEQMNGEEAVVYARFRKDSEKDYGRGMRQQQVISALLSKITTEKKISPELIINILKMVETDISPVLLTKYFSYFNNMTQVAKMVRGEISYNKGKIPNAAWKRIFTKIGMENSLVNNGSVAKALDKIKTMPEYAASPLQLFFTNHQFFNDTYAGYYVTPPEQREEISNALRQNLNLKPEKPKDYDNQFGRYDLPTDEEAYFAGNAPSQSQIDALPDENANQNSTQTPEQQPEEQEHNVVSKPLITGQDKYVINVGGTINLALKAQDANGNPVELKLVSSTLNNEVPGDYQQVYQAVDANGNASDPYIIYISVIGQNNNNQSNQQTPNTIDPSKVSQDAQGRFIYKDNNECWIVVDESGSGQYVKKEKLSECPIA